MTKVASIDVSQSFLKVMWKQVLSPVDTVATSREFCNISGIYEVYWSITIWLFNIAMENHHAINR